MMNVFNYKYSVLMSVYYKEKPDWLRYSIRSILSQTVMPNEILIVKDGQLTNELDSVLNIFIEQYPDLFNIVELPYNRGLGPALAVGVNECRNEIIIRMDSDDFSVPNRCEKLLCAMKKHNECGIIGSYEAEFIDNINNVVAIHRVPELNRDINQFMKRRCAVLHPTVLYKKSYVLKAGNYRDALLYEDYDLFLRMVLKYHIPAYNIPEALYYIRVNDDFFKRRGGFQYMKSMFKFKLNMYKNGYMHIGDFMISAGAHIIVCLLPNLIRKFIYMKFLRN